jgi:hypothetical protein
MLGCFEMVEWDVILMGWNEYGCCLWVEMVICTNHWAEMFMG